MSLKHDNIAAMFWRGRVKKMIKTNVIECRRRGERGNMTAQIGIITVGTKHHGSGIPADHGANALLNL